MANRYELCIGIWNKQRIVKTQRSALTRTKNLRPLLCKTVIEQLMAPCLINRYWIRLRVTCSWRTIIELQKFFEVQEGPVLTTFFKAHKLKWTGSRWR